jgi:hypothetical protein
VQKEKEERKKRKKIAVLHTFSLLQVGNYSDIAPGSTFSELHLGNIWSSPFCPPGPGSNAVPYGYLPQSVTMFQSNHPQQQPPQFQGAGTQKTKCT